MTISVGFHPLSASFSECIASNEDVDRGLCLENVFSPVPCGIPAALRHTVRCADILMSRSVLFYADTDAASYAFSHVNRKECPTRLHGSSLLDVKSGTLQRLRIQAPVRLVGRLLGDIGGVTR